jgi:phi13 family phage major tail protein
MASPAQSTAVGLTDFKYAVMTSGTDVSGGTASYGTVYSIPGLTEANYAGAAGLTRLFADDGIFETSDYVGEQSISINLADILEADQNRIFGFGYANGVLEKSSTSASPYLWIGFKVTLANGTYKYVSIPKVKFSKPDSDNKTKAASVEFQPQMIEGGINNLICNGNYMLTTRTDDTALPAATLAAWFTTPVIAKTVDLTGLTAVITAGAGATKTVLLTLSKVSNSASYPFTIPTTSVTAMLAGIKAVKVSDGTEVTIDAAAVLSAGTGLANSTCTFTLTTSVSNTAVYFVIHENGLVKDASGVSITEYYSGTITTRT